MPNHWKQRICAGLVCGLFGATAASADFETVESPAGVFGDPFSTGAFSGALTFSVGHDDNVLLVPDLPPFFPPGAEKASFYTAVSFNGTYAVPVGPDTVIGITGEISGVRYFKDQSPAFVPLANAPSDYSRFVLQPRLFLSHVIDMGDGGKLRLTPSYSFRHEGGADVAAIGLDSHQLRFDASYAPTARSTISGHILWADNDFDVTFPLAPTSNRDGDYTEAGVAWRIKPVPSRALTVGAMLQDNNSTGTDYEFDGYKVYAEFETHLGRAFFGTFGLSYSDRDYTTGFNYLVPAPLAVPRTDQQVLGLTASILKPLDHRHALQAVVTHDSYMSNSASFSGDKTTIEFSYIMSLP